ncbi:HEPN domain-containing protein [Weeksellaceae bacterium A-14]
MKERSEYKGVWFLPKNPNCRIGGILNFETNSAIRLELFDCYDEPSIEESLTSTHHKILDVICGLTIDGKKITLIGCTESLNINFNNDVRLSSYKCKYLLENIHLSTSLDKVFDKISFTSPILTNWKHPGIIENTLTFSDTNQIKNIKVSVDTDSYWEKYFKLDENYTLQLSSSGNFNDDYGKTEYIFTQNTELSIINHTEKKTFSDFLTKLILALKFLSLATLSEVVIKNLVLYTNSSIGADSRLDAIPVYQVEKTTVLPDKIVFNNQLFTFDDVSDIFSDVINKWYKEEGSLGPIREHLIESIKPKIYFSSLDFLTMIQSLEGYHRRFVNENKLFLRERLNNLLLRFDNIQAIKKNSFDVEKVISTRNYYSHFYHKDKNVLVGRELIITTQKLRTLLICSVLSLIGFDNKKIDTLLINNNYSQ